MKNKLVSDCVSSGSEINSISFTSGDDSRILSTSKKVSGSHSGSDSGSGCGSECESDSGSDSGSDPVSGSSAILECHETSEDDEAY